MFLNDPVVGFLSLFANIFFVFRFLSVLGNLILDNRGITKERFLGLSSKTILFAVLSAWGCQSEETSLCFL